VIVAIRIHLQSTDLNNQRTFFGTKQVAWLAGMVTAGVPERCGKHRSPRSASLISIGVYQLMKISHAFRNWRRF
jgi:hypothetical protein